MDLCIVYVYIVSISTLGSVECYLQICNTVCSLAGAFGEVFAGLLNDPDKNMVDTRVAVKTIKSEHTIIV